MAGAVHLMGLRMATAAGAHVSTYRGAAIFAKRDKFLWPVSGMKTLSGNHSFGKIVFLHLFFFNTYIFIYIFTYIYMYIYTLPVTNIGPLNIRIWETFSFPGKVGLCLFVFGVI